VPAIDLFHKAIAIAPDAHAYGGLGVAQDLAGDYKAADEAFRQALALAPHDLDLRNNYGLTQALMGNYEAAVATMRAVATDAAAGPRHRLNFALVLGLAGRTDEARRVASVDLDERAVNSNLAYYAVLRQLPAKQRAAAILRPQAGDP
jgi:Flp pilus assembly protein TadD